MLPAKSVSENYLKWFDHTMRHFVNTTGISESHIRFMLFCYDYEFWTRARIARDYANSPKNLYERTILPLKNAGYIIAYFNHGNDSQYIDGHLQVTHGLAARLSLSHKGRHAVQRFYRMVSGEEPISYAPHPNLNKTQ